MAELPAHLLLFLSAFGSATLLPLQSEAVLIGLLLAEPAAVGSLLLTATLGNVLGAQLNWLLGRYLERLRGRRGFPLSPTRLAQAQRWYGRYGRWSLLLSWVPVIGDPLTLVAGVMGEPWWRFTLLVGLAKGGRYLLLALLTLGWS